ncbi:MAG: BMP family ABC transporter substrate-binding protein [Ruminococcaceae bacterium]|nr:BMP family ABC transporter substrate-binding protein [Oscillospiraceae bacterium]
MKRVISILLAVMLTLSAVFALSGCGKNKAESYDLVLITDGAAVNDKGYNQSAWDGVKSYGDKNDMTYRYYQPALDEEGNLPLETIKNYIDIAVKDGAKYIVLPGEVFAVAAYEIAPTYSDVNFILVDALPHSQDDNTLRLQSNVMSVKFNTLQAGYLAGYSAVIDGYKKLGFVGSINSEDSVNYGAGYVQGAAYAADELNTPVVMDYAEFDNPNLAYDYSFTVKPVYKKISDSKEKTFKVNVVDGIGSGVYTDGENVQITCNPAPEGKRFDHWEVKSDTEGVKDKKVNISSKKDWQMNLLVGDCDCTITPVWADTETVKLSVALPQYTQQNESTAVMSSESETYFAPVNSSYWVNAPAAPSGYVFDHWETENAEIIDNINEKGINVSVSEKDIQLTPVYVKSEYPTFDVTVENGTGSGSYVTGDDVEVVADAPEDGYMFYKWENVDNQGLASGIAMENEFCYKTSFEMVDRFASVSESMYDSGTQVVFGGGSPLSDSIFLSTWEFDYQVYAFGSGFDEAEKGNCLASVVTDYNQAIQLAVKEFKGGSIFTADCSNNCIYVTGKSVNEFQLDGEGKPTEDKDGNKIKDENYNEHYATIYKALSEGKIVPQPVRSGQDVTAISNSACMSLNYRVSK